MNTAVGWWHIIVVDLLPFLTQFCHNPERMTESSSRFVNHPQVVADAIQRLWPIFKAIFDM